MIEQLQTPAAKSELHLATQESGLHTPEQQVLQAIAEDVVQRSQDPHLKTIATERNAAVTGEDIWQLQTLHHATKLSKLRDILDHGQLGVRHETEAIGYGPAHTAMDETAINFGIPLHELPTGASHKDNIDNLSYSRHAGAELYLHYTRSADSYRSGLERQDGDIRYMDGGMPSTEISAISLCAQSEHAGTPAEQLDSVSDAIAENGQFIPVFTEGGEKAYTREQFDADRAAINAGTYISRTERRSAAKQTAEKQSRIAEAQRLVAAANQAGMTVEEYQNRPTEDIHRPPM